MLFCLVLSCCTMANAHAGMYDRYLDMKICVDAIVMVIAVIQVSIYLFLRYRKSKVSCGSPDISRGKLFDSIENLYLCAMNLTDVLNLSLVKGVMNVEKKIAHTGSMTHRAAVCIYRLLHLIAEETHLAPQIILHAPYDEILYRLLPLLAIRQIKHHRAAETIRQTTLGKLGVRLVVSQLSHLHNLILQALDKLASLTAVLETAG